MCLPTHFIYFKVIWHSDQHLHAVTHFKRQQQQKILLQTYDFNTIVVQDECWRFLQNKHHIVVSLPT